MRPRVHQGNTALHYPLQNILYNIVYTRLVNRTYNAIFSQSQSNLQPKWSESLNQVEPGPSTPPSHTRSKVEVFNYEIDTDEGKDAILCSYFLNIFQYKGHKSS